MAQLSCFNTARNQERKSGHDIYCDYLIESQRFKRNPVVIEKERRDKLNTAQHLNKMMDSFQHMKNLQEAANFGRR